MAFNLCKDCRLANLKDLQCMLTRLPIGLKDKACANFTKELFLCEICNQQMAKPGIMVETEQDFMMLCSNCSQKVGFCYTCECEHLCPFEQDPSTIPKMIQKQVRQGNMQMITQVPNPERIKITCETDCKCYDKEIGCLKKKSQCCWNWKFRRKS